MKENVDVTKVVELMDKSEDLSKQSDKLKKKANKLVSEARELCPHPATTEKSDYYDGSYLDHASTTTVIYCTICGKRLKSETETHSWYG